MIKQLLATTLLAVAPFNAINTGTTNVYNIGNWEYYTIDSNEYKIRKRTIQTYASQNYECYSYGYELQKITTYENTNDYTNYTCFYLPIFQMNNGQVNQNINLTGIATPLPNFINASYNSIYRIRYSAGVVDNINNSNKLVIQDLATSGTEPTLQVKVAEYNATESLFNEYANYFKTWTVGTDKSNEVIQQINTNTIDDLPTKQQSYNTLQEGVNNHLTIYRLEFWSKLESAQNLVNFQDELNSQNLVNLNIDANWYATPVQEVVDLPGLLFEMLGMPFAWISIAFNFTLFPGTPYAINISHIIMGLIVIGIAIFILKKVYK